METEEQWRPVVGYEGLYEVSDQGRVRRAGRVLRPGRAKNGYFTVSLWSQNVGRSFNVHQLVAAAFIGPRPTLREVCHSNGNRTDNRLTNLRYDTRSGNQQDAILHGTRVWGERHRSAKLTELDVHEIRSLYPSRGPTELSAVYGVSPSAIYNAATGITWKHLKEPDARIGSEGVA